MRKSSVHIGQEYEALVSGRVVRVRVLCASTRGVGWEAENLSTKRRIWVRSGRRLRPALRGEERRRETAPRPRVRATTASLCCGGELGLLQRIVESVLGEYRCARCGQKWTELL